MKSYSYDLHIHSCLSPCGDMDMTVNNIVNMAALTGCDIIALTDHNTCKNVPAAMKIGESVGVVVVPGMELCTSEEVHVVCLFESLEGAMAFDEYVYERIPDIKNDEAVFGSQAILNEEDEIVGKVDKLLVTSADIALWELTDILSDFGGVAIPAHIDRDSYSVLSSLGEIPTDCGFKYVEIRDKSRVEELKEEYPYLNELNILHDSDSHYLENFPEGYEKIELESLSVKSLIDKIRDI